ncbi:MAG: hypothetical protein KAQ78_06985, partial [Candidatus Latescibacteria bacterium]|nr:hypothetical protein [Candidatus Latescibacterota bacterium]
LTSQGYSYLIKRRDILNRSLTRHTSCFRDDWSAMEGAGVMETGGIFVDFWVIYGYLLRKGGSRGSQSA